MISRIFRLCLALTTGVILAFAGVPDAIAKCGGETKIGNLIAFLNCDPTGISYRKISRAMDRDMDKICRRACSNVRSAKCRKEYLKLIDRHRNAVKKYARSKGCKFRSKYFDGELKETGGEERGSEMFKGCKATGNWKRTVYKPSSTARSQCDFLTKDVIICEIGLWCDTFSELHKVLKKDVGEALDGLAQCLADPQTKECPPIRECLKDETVNGGKDYLGNYLERGKKGKSLEEQEGPKGWGTKSRTR